MKNLKHLLTGNDISKKSIATMVDELITVNIKCFMAQEIVMTEDTDIDKIAKASKNAQELNKRRNMLIRAIDKELGMGNITLTSKTY